MNSEFKAVGMSEETVEWLTETVEKMQSGDKVERATGDRLDDFIKSVDNIIDQLNVSTLFATILEDAMIAGHDVIVRLYKDVDEEKVPKDITKLLDVYMESLTVVNNADTAFFGDE